MAQPEPYAVPHVTGHVDLVHRARGDKWYARYRINGHQNQKCLGPAHTGPGRPPAGHFTQKTAEAALQAILTDARRGELPDPVQTGGRTFGDASAEWLRYCEHDRQRRPSTIRDYRNVVRANLDPEFGSDTPLHKVTTERVEAYRSRLLSEGELSRRTVQKILVLLHGIFKLAVRRGWINSNPSARVERVSVQRSGDFNVLSPEQVCALARAADDDQDAALYTVAAFTGLRQGELIALRWRDVDWTGELLHVRASFTHGNAGRPKSGKVRSTLLIPHTIKALNDLSRRELFTAPDDLIFPSPTGEYQDASRLRKRFVKALDRAGLDRIRFHDLRHTFGTLAARKHPLHDVQAWMGHASSQTTEIYTHSVPKRDAARKLGALVDEEVNGGANRVSKRVSNSALHGAIRSNSTQLAVPATPSTGAVPSNS